MDSCALPRPTGIDPDDVQAQVDAIYAHILSSVDLSLENASQTRKSRPSTATKVRPPVEPKQKGYRYEGRAIPAATETSTPVTASTTITTSSTTMSGTCCGLPRGNITPTGSGTTSGGPDRVLCRCCCNCNLDVTIDVSTSTNVTESRGTLTHSMLSSDASDRCPCQCSCPCHTHSCPHQHEQEKERKDKTCQPPFKLDATNDERMTASRRRLSPSGSRPTRVNSQKHTSSTFGSGRKGMLEPIKKSFTPGPGSYFQTEAITLRESAKVSTSRSRQMQHASQLKLHIKKAAKDAKALKQQFALSCQCYWKQFPELEMATNPAAHATNCPCQLIRTDSQCDHSSARSSSSRSSHTSVRSGRPAKPRGSSRIRAVSARPEIPSALPRSSQRGAVFGTSPRRTIFAERTNEQRSNRPQSSILSHSSDEETPDAPKSGRQSGKEENGTRSQGQGRYTDNGNNNNNNNRISPTRKCSTLIPGPGAYNVASAFDAASARGKSGGVSIGRAPRQLHTTNDAPGPGTYSMETPKTLESHSEGKKYFLTSTPRQLELVVAAEKCGETLPGPGEYQIDDASRVEARHKNAPVFSFGRAPLTRVPNANLTATEDAEGIPGPGTYDVSGAMSDGGGVSRSSGRRIVMTTARRDDHMWCGVRFDPDDVPGPGTYTLLDATQGPSYSLRARPLDRVEPTPGPGQYDLPEESRGPQWSLATRPPSHTTDETPGPGEYFVPVFDLRRQHSTAPLFGTAPRVVGEDTREVSVLPGPGAYDASSAVGQSTRAAVMGTATRSLELTPGEAHTAPGPGAYVVQYDSQHKRVGVPILAAGSPRFHDVEMTSMREAPGPGYYDVDAQLALVNKRSVVLGSAPRTSVFDAVSVTTGAGPGAYDVPLPKGGPSFTMGHRQGNATTVEPSPGPGFYDTERTTYIGALSHRPSALLGTAERFIKTAEERAKLDVPGPGSYMTTSGAGGVLGMSPDGKGRAGGGGGGGGAVFGTSPRLFIGTNAADSGVGPGAYDPEGIQTHIPGVVWGTEERFNMQKDESSPGPGAYEANTSQPSPVRGAVFGTAGEKSAMDWMLPADAALTPGPGSYVPQHPQEHVTSAVFGSAPQRVGAAADQNLPMGVTPGPGAYVPAAPQPHAFHASFGTATRHETHPDLRLGPGQYSPMETNVPSPQKVTFGTAPRSPTQTGSYSETPGPGAYMPMDKLTQMNSPGSGPVTFPSAQRFSEVHNTGNNPSLLGYGQGGATPGPGAYAVEERMVSIGSRGGAVGFGTAPRNVEYEERESAMLPGPGQYSPSNHITSSAPPAYAFGKESREQVTLSDGPGPGAYDVIIPTFTAPVMRFGTEKRELGPLILAEVPGPGSYDVNNNIPSQATAPVYRFPTAPREVSPHLTSVTPGPGEYDHEFDWRQTASPSFPTAPRFTSPSGGEGEGSSLPGPGQYSLSHPTWKTGHVYSFPTDARMGNDTTNATAELPGPGAYDPRQLSHQRTPSPVFGTEPRRSPEVSGATDQPGPGYYNPPLQPEGPYIRFGIAERGLAQGGNGTSNDIPGPGTYDILMRSPDGPVFSLHRTAARGPTLIEVEKSQLPGPGTYTVPSTFPASDAEAVSFPKAVRFQLPNESNQPGPGHYDSMQGDVATATHTDGSVAMRFTTARFASDSKSAEIPGPAAYNVHDPQHAVAPNAPSFPQASRFVVAEQRDASLFPGPGEYSLPGVWDHAKGGFSFGTGARMAPVDATQEGVPGPGAYDAGRYAERFMTGPAFTLQGKPVEFDHSDALPGPGMYNLRPLDAPRVASFAPLPTIDPNAAFASRVNETPGPAQYCLPNSLSHRATTIGTSQRPEPRGEELPGPGAYLTGGPIILANQPSFSFATAPRPGPEAEVATSLLGPGEYHHPLEPRSNAPAFTFAGAERFTNHLANPAYGGSGSYYKPVYAEEGPAYSFPHAPRPPPARSDSALGPGEHFHPTRWDETSGHGPTFPNTRGWSAPLPGADTPGPGAYYRDEGQTEKKGPRAQQGVSFSSEQKKGHRAPVLHTKGKTAWR